MLVNKNDVHNGGAKAMDASKESAIATTMPEEESANIILEDINRYRENKDKIETPLNTLKLEENMMGKKIAIKVTFQNDIDDDTAISILRKCRKALDIHRTQLYCEKKNITYHDLFTGLRYLMKPWPFYGGVVDVAIDGKKVKLDTM